MGTWMLIATSLATLPQNDPPPHRPNAIPTLSPTTSSFLFTPLFLLLPVFFLASPSQRPGLIAWLTLFVRPSSESPFPFPIFRALPILLSSLPYHRQYHLEFTTIAFHPLHSLSSPPPRLFDHSSIEFSLWRDRAQ